MNDPKKALEEYEIIRESGLTNMFDRNAVHNLAKKFGFPELKEASKDNKTYGELLKNYKRPEGK